MPEARVFRPKSEEEDKLIGVLLQHRFKAGLIEKPSWTTYVSYLLNKDLALIKSKSKITGG